MSSRFAAIDIGTVTCRMLIADVDEDGLHELCREYGITNLGEGVDATGMLSQEAMGRVAAQIATYQDIIRTYEAADSDPVQVIALATSASRDAANASEFLGILDGLGIRLTVISGDKEAALSFLGASSEFKDENILVVDIGGGSTEVSAGRAGELPIQEHSFDIGCRRVTERYLASDPPTDEELAQAQRFVREGMQGYFDTLADKDFKVDRLVAVAGTATSVVSIHKHMAVYDSALVHRSVIARDELAAVHDTLRSLPLAKRRQVVGLDPDRASVIVAGTLILESVLDLAGQPSFTASESDILQGIILDAAGK